MRKDLLLARLDGVLAWTREPSRVVTEDSAGGRFYYRQALEHIKASVEALKLELENEAKN